MFVSRKKYESMKRGLERQIQELTSRNDSLVKETKRREREKEEGRVKGAWCKACDNSIDITGCLGTEYYCAYKPPCPNFVRSKSGGEK